MNKALKAAVFFDRDGTLIDDTGYLSDPAGVRLLPTVAPALAALGRAHFERVVISNQSGVARGLMSIADVEAVEAELRRRLIAEGADLEAFYRCPHLDSDCVCRKPEPGLIHQAARERNLDLGRSIFIGDRGTDIAAGKAAGLKTILVTTGPLVYTGPEPDLTVAALGDAVDWILQRAD